jgi:hypothetical protein
VITDTGVHGSLPAQPYLQPSHLAHQAAELPMSLTPKHIAKKVPSSQAVKSAAQLLARSQLPRPPGLEASETLLHPRVMQQPQAPCSRSTTALLCCGHPTEELHGAQCGSLSTRQGTSAACSRACVRSMHASQRAPRSGQIWSSATSARLELHHAPRALLVQDAVAALAAPARTCRHSSTCQHSRIRPAPLAHGCSRQIQPL